MRPPKSFECCSKARQLENPRQAVREWVLQVGKPLQPHVTTYNTHNTTEFTPHAEHANVRTCLPGRLLCDSGFLQHQRGVLPLFELRFARACLGTIAVPAAHGRLRTAMPTGRADCTPSSACADEVQSLAACGSGVGGWVSVLYKSGALSLLREPSPTELSSSAAALVPLCTFDCTYFGRPAIVEMLTLLLPLEPLAPLLPLHAHSALSYGAATSLSSSVATRARAVKNTPPASPVQKLSSTTPALVAEARTELLAIVGCGAESRLTCARSQLRFRSEQYGQGLLAVLRLAPHARSLHIVGTYRSAYAKGEPCAIAVDVGASVVAVGYTDGSVVRWDARASPRTHLEETAVIVARRSGGTEAQRSVLSLAMLPTHHVPSRPATFYHTRTHTRKSAERTGSITR
jgi:hypothetical protein